MDTGTALGVSAAAGVAVPFVISFLKDTEWSLKVKQLIAFVISLVVAVGVTVVDKGVSLDSWQALLANLGVLFTTAQLFYTQYFSDTTLNAKLEDSGVGAK